MSIKLMSILKITAVAIPLGLTACASTGDMTMTRGMASKAQSTADQALSKANSAQSAADQALARANEALSKANDAASKANDASRAAGDAMSKANDASRTAGDAKSAADMMNEKSSRMFKKSMQK